MRIRDLAILRSAGAGMWGNALQSANASRAAGARQYAGPVGRKDGAAAGSGDRGSVVAKSGHVTHALVRYERLVKQLDINLD